MRQRTFDFIVCSTAENAHPALSQVFRAVWSLVAHIPIEVSEMGSPSPTHCMWHSHSLNHLRPEEGLQKQAEVRLGQSHVDWDSVLQKACVEPRTHFSSLLID